MFTDPSRQRGAPTRTVISRATAFASPAAAAWTAVILIIATCGCSDQKKRAEDLVRAGTAEARSGDHAAAVQSFSRALAIDTRLAEAHYGRGVSQAALGLHTAAIESLQAAVRLRPVWADAWFALGTAQRAAGETALSVESLSTALQHRSDFADARYDRACALLQLHDPAAAVADLDVILSTSPRHAAARLQRARCILRTSPEQALEDLTVVLTADPQNVTAMSLRGTVYGRLSRFEEAVEDLNHACGRQPKNAANWLARGRVLRLAGRLDEAAADLNTALALDPSAADVLCELALTAKAGGHIEQSRRLLLDALRLQPSHAEARIALADDLAGSGNHTDALAELRTLLDQPEIGLPANADLLTGVRLRRAEWLRATDQIPAALAELRAVLQSEPHHEQARRLHAQLLQQLQRHEEAIADLTQLISRRHSDPELLMARASSNVAIRRSTAALQDLNEILNASPRSLPALALRAGILANSGHRDAALKDLDAAIAAAPAAEKESLQWERLRLLDTPEQAARAEAARRQLADAAFGDSARLTRVAGEFQRAAAHAELLSLLRRAAAQCPEALTPDLRLTLASLLADRAEWSAADESLAALPEDYRRTTPALLLNTRAAIAANQHARAAELLSQVPLADQPDELRSQLISALVDAGLFEKAAAFVPESPGHPDSLLVKAVNLAAAGQLREAVETLQIPVSIPQPRPAALWTLAQCHAALEQRSDARYVLSKLLLIQPAHAQARLLRARLALEQQDFEGAAADLSLLLKQEPDHGEALLMQGALRFSSGRHLDALRDLTRLLRLRPQYEDALYLRARVLHSLNRNPEAIADLNQALESNAAYPEALLLLGTITAAEGDSAGALQLFDRVLELQPRSFKAWSDRGSLLYQTGRFEQAAAAWSHALECRPEDLRTRIRRAAALRKLQNDAAALDDYHEVLRRDPDNNTATLLAATLLISSSDGQLRNPDAAEKLARIACEKSRFRDPRSLRVLAQACIARQRPDEAAEWTALAQRITSPAASAPGTSTGIATHTSPAQQRTREARVDAPASRY